MKYPMNFATTSESQKGISSKWSSRSGEYVSSLAIPEEFGGIGGGLSPEDLFNQALTNCFLATFKVYAEKSGLVFEKVTAQSNLTVDFDESQKPIMKRIDVNVQIHKPENADKALLLAKKASDSGFILNSVKTERHFEFEVVQ